MATKKQTFEVEYEISIRSSTLKPRFEGETFVKEITKLTPEEKRLNTRSTPELEFHEKYYQGIFSIYIFLNYRLDCFSKFNLWNFWISRNDGSICIQNLC